MSLIKRHESARDALLFYEDAKDAFSLASSSVDKKVNKRVISLSVLTRITFGDHKRIDWDDTLVFPAQCLDCYSRETFFPTLYPWLTISYSSRNSLYMWSDQETETGNRCMNTKGVVYETAISAFDTFLSQFHSILRSQVSGDSLYGSTESTPFLHTLFLYFSLSSSNKFMDRRIFNVLSFLTKHEIHLRLSSSSRF